MFPFSQGVKANVLFFENKPAQEKPWTKKLWVYNFRINMHFTLKTNPFTTVLRTPPDCGTLFRLRKRRHGCELCNRRAFKSCTNVD